MELTKMGWSMPKYVYPQHVIRRNMPSMGKKAAAEYYSRGNKIGAMTVGGFIAAGEGAAYATGAGIYTWVSGLTWLSVPTNQLTMTTAAGFVFNVLNPDPGAHVDFPGYGNEIAQPINLALRNRSGKAVHFLAEKGATFSNKSEWKWAQKLLDEGHNVMVWKDVRSKGVQNGDLWIDSLITEIK